MSNLGQKIRRYRESKKLSISSLARKSGTSVANISRYESGLVPNPSSEMVAKIAKGLGVKVTELLGGKEITSADVIEFIREHDLSEQEIDLLRAFRAKGPVAALGILSLVTRDPKWVAAFEKSLLSATPAERAEFSNKFGRGLQVGDEES